MWQRAHCRRARCAGKRYFQHTKLADIIGAYPYKAGLSDEDMAKESERREAFLDFLMGVLVGLALDFRVL